ncbi:MAG: FG-GAP repeat domain-containing protein [Pirellulaceae bacterium]
MNRQHFARGVAMAWLGLIAIGSPNDTAQAAVGHTEASYGVTQNGAANYTIPIRATEGINSMTPRLAINYVGPGSRSIFGVGFALSGISYVTPCRKTIAQDLNAAPVTLTASDRYCLDGARLRLVTGTPYGASETTYRTELDQMIRVTAKASTNNIPGWFRVEMPDGLEYEYGNSTTSRLMSGTSSGATPQFWAVSKISDPYGNSIVFTYDTDAATKRFRPSVISYTERGGIGHYKISFVYGTTLQLSPRYYFTPSATGGVVHKEDKVLDRIELKHDDVVYRAYKFLYEGGAGNNERLASVQECAYAPSEDCLPATQFTWQSATEGHNSLASTGQAVASGVMPLDINGDGIEDLVWASGGTWRYMLGGTSGFGSIVNTAVAATNASKAMPLEWNGDGFWDLLIDWSDGKWRVLRGGAGGFNTAVVQAGPGGITSTTSNTAWAIADVDADGRDDLVSVRLNAMLAINVRFNGASGFGGSTQVFADEFVHTKASNPFIPMNGASSAIRRPDFNGDGRTDLLIYGCIWEPEPPGWCITNRWFQILSQGATFTNEGPITYAGFNIHVRYGDFNGDGLTDAIYPATTGSWYLGFGQGSGGFSLVAGPSSAGYATYQTLTGDYDGDGLDDFYVTRNSPLQWEVFRSTGTGLAPNPVAPSPSISGTGVGWMLRDQNGDSLPDLGRYDSGTLVWSVGTHQGLPGERLLSATDGLGNAVSFSYLPMTDSAVYAK